MEIATVQGEGRKPGSKHANENLRRRGLVPAVIYGHGEANDTVSLSRHDLELALKHLNHVIQLDIDGQTRQYLIKDVQYDHLQKTPVHVDLMRVDPNERVEVKVPVELKGTPLGVAEGGNLVQVITDLEVECPLLEIPEQIRARVDHLKLNEGLQVSTLQLPEGVRVLHEPGDIVAVVHPPRGMTTAEIEALEGAEEGAAEEPEVIGKGKEEKEGENAGEA
jgi:large subunit ribosomal protein L25